MIAVIDYGAGNLRSVANALEEIGCEYTLVHNAEGLQGASKIILPGVGHFGQMMRALAMRDALIESIRAGVPYFGICLGMQALFESSEEAPEVAGLGIFPGAVRRFPKEARVPHMGWNEVEAMRESRLISRRSHVYFAHSYYVPDVPQTVARCEYGVPFTAALECGSVFGVQFHPEKSGAVGLEVLHRFVRLA